MDKTKLTADLLGALKRVKTRTWVILGAGVTLCFGLFVAGVLFLGTWLWGQTSTLVDKAPELARDMISQASELSPETARALEASQKSIEQAKQHALELKQHAQALGSTDQLQQAAVASAAAVAAKATAAVSEQLGTAAARLEAMKPEPTPESPAPAVTAERVDPQSPPQSE